MTVTSAFSVFSVEPFPTIKEGDSITDALLSVLDAQDRHLLDGDIVVVASKIVSISEKRHVDLATPTGPIIARHTLGYQLTCAGIDCAGTSGAWLPPIDPDASARHLRAALSAATGTDVAVVIADSDSRADRRGATVISLGAAGITPLRITEHTEPTGHVKRQEETLTDMIAATAGIVLGQRGRGAPVTVVRGVAYQPSDDGVLSIRHRRHQR